MIHACRRPGLALAALMAILFQDLPAQGRAPAGSVSIRAVPAREQVHPGDQTVIAIVLAHGPGFHTWPHEPVVPPEFAGVNPIATEVTVLASPAGTEVQPIQWPEPKPVTANYTGTPVTLLAYVDTAVAYLPIRLPSLPAGAAELRLVARYQACDERICYFPRRDTLTVSLRVVPAGAPVEAVPNPELFKEFDLASFGGAGAGATLRPVTLSAFGWSVTVNPGGTGGMIALLLLAALGGAVLNLTPCVLPLIPIKVMGLSQAAGSPGRLRHLGAAMTAGVVVFWVGLGAAIGLVAGFTAINSLFQTGWFAPLVGLVVAAMGLGMMGWFDARLPQWVYRLNPRQDTLPGSFGFGVLTAVLSTPCTAPFMAGAAAWAALQRPATTMLTFGAIGAGMALPYLALSLKPSLIARVPRGGPAGVVVKQVMGLLMLAVASFFLGSSLSARFQHPPEPAARWWWWVVMSFVVAAAVWTIRETWRLSPSVRRRAATLLVGGVTAAAALGAGRSLASHGPIDWVYFTPERFAAAEAEGRVIVLDFTAEWCLNCKALESGVLHRREIVALLRQPGVVPMRVDLTSDNPAGQAKLAELGWVGIPLLAIYGPGLGDEPLKYDSYTPGLILDGVRRARGVGIDP